MYQEKRGRVRLILLKFIVIIYPMYLFFILSCNNNSYNISEIKYITEPSKKIKDGGRLNINLPGNVTSLDPIDFANSNFLVGLNIFDTLVKTDKFGNIIPNIAKSWRISKDGRTYRFYIRGDVKFHNGSRLTVNDIVYSFKRFREIDKGFTSYLNDIVGFDGFDAKRKLTDDKISKGFRIISDYNFEINLKKPNSNFLYIMTSPIVSIVPMDYYSGAPQRFKVSPIGSGPYILKDFKKEKITLIANSNYFLQKPHLKEVTFHVLSDSTAIKRFLEKKLDAYFSQTTSCDRCKENRDILEEKLHGGKIWELFLNNKSPVFRNKEIRQFLFINLDREKILKILNRNDYNSTQQHIPKGFNGFLNSSKISSIESSNKWKNIHDIKSLITKLRPSNRKIKYIYAEYHPWSHNFEEYLNSFFKSLGLTVSFKKLDASSYIKILFNKDFDIAQVFLGIDYPNSDFKFSCFHSLSHYNFSNFIDGEYDSVVDQSFSTSSIDIKRQLQHRAAEILLTEVPVIPIAESPSYLYYRNYIKLRGNFVNADLDMLNFAFLED